MAQNEILTEVIIPDQEMTGSTYNKFALRRAGALAVVGVAVAVQVENDIIKDARIALGAVAPVPMRAKKTEEFLKGKKISDELLDEAGRIALQNVSLSLITGPLQNIAATWCVFIQNVH